MRAKVNLKVEIIEGPDAGYILEETNRLIDLQRSVWPDNEITPYKIQVEFVTPNILRNHSDSSAPHWIEESDCEGKRIDYICSKCGFDDGWKDWKFCPKCGNIMKVELDDEDEFLDEED